MLQLRESKGCWWARLVVQVGRSVEGSCWRKVGMVGIWESIRMEVSRGSLLFEYAGMNNVYYIL